MFKLLNSSMALASFMELEELIVVVVAAGKQTFTKDIVEPDS